MISSPSKSSEFSMIRRAQSTDIEWSNYPNNDSHRHNNNDHLVSSESSSSTPNRLDSIFRSRPKTGMSPIGTRKLLPASSVDSTVEEHDGIPSIRPSLSCPAAVFESPLRNLLDHQPKRPPSSLAGIRDESMLRYDDGVPDASIDFDDEASAIPEDGESHNHTIMTDAELLSAVATTTSATANDNHESSSFPRNLNNAFDLLVPKTTAAASTTTTTDEQCRYQPPTMISIEQITVPHIHLPLFTLSPQLSASLSPGVISRVSFYSIVRDINAEASVCQSTDPVIASGREVSDADGRVHVHPRINNEEKSILFGNEWIFSNNMLLDEEWFLLSAIASRESWEVEANGEMLLPTFAEAMGETKEESAGSRTQLWKPGRSWWEAKSGKNPWVEPVVHNNRWR